MKPSGCPDDLGGNHQRIGNPGSGIPIRSGEPGPRLRERSGYLVRDFGLNTSALHGLLAGHGAENSASGRVLLRLCFKLEVDTYFTTRCAQRKSYITIYR